MYILGEKVLININVRMKVFSGVSLVLGGGFGANRYRLSARPRREFRHRRVPTPATPADSGDGLVASCRPPPKCALVPGHPLLRCFAVAAACMPRCTDTNPRTKHALLTFPNDNWPLYVASRCYAVFCA